MHEKTLIGMVGLPYSGKSTAARELGFPIVCPDAIRLALHGQRFILRDETAQSTIGGGHIIRPASRRFRPLQQEASESLSRADSDDPLVRYGEAVRAAGCASWAPNRIACAVGVSPEDVPELARRLHESGQIVEIRGSGVHRDTVAALQQRTIRYVKRHHRVHPSEPGVLRDRLVGWIDQRSIPGWGKVIVKRLLDAEGLRETGPYLADAEFRPALAPEDAALLERLLAEISTAKFDVPAWPKLATVTTLPKQRARMLEDLAKCEPGLVPIGMQQYLSADAVGRFKSTVKGLAAGGPFKLAEVRDALGLSRRVVQPLLEYLDRVGYTRRVGDERVLVEKDS